MSQSKRLEREMYRHSLEGISGNAPPEEVRFWGVEWEEERVSVKRLARRFSALQVGTRRPWEGESYQARGMATQDVLGEASLGDGIMYGLLWCLQGVIIHFHNTYALCDLGLFSHGDVCTRFQPLMQYATTDPSPSLHPTTERSPPFS